MHLTTPRRRFSTSVAATLSSALLVAACAGDALPASESPGADATATESQPPNGSEPTSGAGSEPERGVPVDASLSALPGQLLIDPEVSIPFDRRLLGTNVPAWLGPERLLDPAFQSEAVASGATVLRMPGGSWSNGYDWLGCELADDSRCFWTWAARPSDFVDFLQATGIEGMWTVSINETAQAGAAAVAFFNGSVDDTTEIGVDRNGVDWETVGTWARLRAEGGNPDPLRIELWEVGNEVYGGKPEAGGAECASFGWETVWTCDGTEYTLGTEEHDGYLDIRAAMIAVDPDIEVGAVGVAGPGAWTNWGNEVIEGAGDDLDFYVVHGYGFDGSPSASEALRRPGQFWPRILGEVAEVLPPDVPIAVTEYNLVSFEAGDTNQSMTRAVNALFIADSIGQIAQSGASFANQWNLANGVTGSGTDYGLLDVDNGGRRPQFAALEAWSAVGTTLYAASAADDDLNAYPTRHDDGRWTIIAINLGESDLETAIVIPGLAGDIEVSVESATIVDLDGTTVEMSSSNTTQVASSEATASVQIPGYSITTIEFSEPPLEETTDG